MSDYGKDEKQMLLFSEALTEFADDEMTVRITPVRRILPQIFAGLALGMITIQAGAIGKLLPFAGALFCFVGFRALRRENIWFRMAYVISLLKLLLSAADVMLSATAAGASPGSAVLTGWTLAGALLELLRLSALHKGILAVQESAGIARSGRAVLGLIFWYLALCVLAFTGWESPVVLAAMLAVYGMILWAISRTVRLLESAGYALRPAAERISDPVLACLIFGILLAGLALCLAFGQRLPMTWQPAEGREETAAALRLEALGVPEEVRKDLSAEDMAGFENALRVILRRHGFAADPGENGQEMAWEEADLVLCDIAIELPENVWVMVHHFSWQKTVPLPGTEAFQIWPLSIQEGWYSDRSVSGRILCSRRGEEICADLPALMQEEEVSDWFGGTRSQMRVTSEFAFPQGAEKARGYLIYRMEKPDLTEWTGIDFGVCYTRQEAGAVYPFLRAIEKSHAGQKEGGFCNYRVTEIGMNEE